MTFQPPPPPPGSTPPPPPPASTPGGSFDPKSVNTLDWGILGIGGLTFIFSFVDWYSFSSGPYSVSENAWHGFFGWFAVLLAVVGSGAVAVHLFAPTISLPVPPRVAAFGAYLVALLCVILALFVTPSYQGVDVPDNVDTGRDFGFWASLILVIAGAVLSLMRAQQTNTALPGPLNNMPKIG